MPRRSMNRSTVSPLKQQSAAQYSAESGPLIPTDWIDAPSQRFYAFALYLALMSWRLYDWNTLQDSEEQSLWLFMKWLFIDGAFMFGLPSLRIPWLEWEPQTMLGLFLGHAIVDGMLMFQVGLPIGAGFAAVGRSFWGAYEMAVNEHNVNPQSVMHNESLILGRQIIHILPEGSAMLNVEREAFCIDGVRTEARLPITINATSPISIDLLRIDLDTQANETIHLSKSQIKTMHKEASRMISYSDKPNEPKTLYHTVKKPGLYVLQKVIDETNLEVSRKRLAHTVVVPCPKASVKQPSSNKCKGELSDVEMEVTGTPPLRVKYRKMINKSLIESSFESIQPDNFYSPLTKQDSNALVVPNRVDSEWARTRHVSVPLSEHLGTAGDWVYSIDEVQDGFGNKIVYSEQDQDEQERSRSKKTVNLHQTITVHERPNVNLKGCTPQMPLPIAKGKTADLPVQYGSTGKSIKDAYRLEYVFTPDAALSTTGEHGPNPQRQVFTAKNSGQQPSIREPGLYTLTGVSTEFCQGEVMEPASCLLQNPPEPELTIKHDEIFDKCAGSPIGLRVNLDLVGTAPFEITYKTMKKGDRHHSLSKPVRISGHRGQIELTPLTAGHYTYEFLEISDAVYKDQSLKHKNLRLEQDVKPSASAGFVDFAPRHAYCINEQVDFEVLLRGEGPFILDYEILHAGKRSQFQIKDIEGDRKKFTTPQFSEGGEYTVALTSVTDRLGCKEFLKDEKRISVRHQMPKVAFSTIDGHRSIEMLEDKRAALPLRLMAGEGPWTVQYTDPSGRSHQMTASKPNDKIEVSVPGTYELTELHDSSCPGQVDETANKFDVSLIPRPEMRIARSSEKDTANTIFKQDICEGDEDAVEIYFKGLPPFKAQYAQKIKPLSGTMSPKNKDLRAALNVASLRMDTSQAGAYEYIFDKLSDSNYDHTPGRFSPLKVKQTVHQRPSAAFDKPGKTYSFCNADAEGDEEIPVTFSGTPPFTLEVELKQIGSMRPETVLIKDIKTKSYMVKIPRKNLFVGKSSVALRRVTDSNTCSRTLDSSTPRVQISVHAAPDITPLESATENCVGDRLNFGLSGTAPFNVFYTFEGAERKATSQSTTFRRLAEKPGLFTITGVQDSASSCRSTTKIEKRIHGMPSVRVSNGKDSYVDIHEGGEAEILFEFGGSPPFEFTYTRSSNSDKKGKPGRGEVLDMRSEISYEHSMRIAAHEEGTYEVVAIKDRYCAYSRPGVKVGEKSGQKKLGYY